jgi:lipopolysaccharide assembly protein A
MSDERPREIRMSTPQQAPRENWFVRTLKRKWLAILLVILVLILAIQNGLATEQATVGLLWLKITVPTWLLVAVIFVVGGVVGWVFARNRAARRARKYAAQVASR